MNLPRPKHTLREYVALYQGEHTKLGNRLTHMVGIPMIVLSFPVAVVNPPAAAGLFAAGWALQLVGHYVFEGNKPAFFGDPYYLLVGPVWVATEWMQLFGLEVPEALRAEQGGAGPREANGSATAEAT